jgi:hypothetical protein
MPPWPMISGEGGSNPIAQAAGYLDGGWPMPLAYPWPAAIFNGAAGTSGGGGGGGSTILVGGLGISVVEAPSGTWTVAGTYAANNGVQRTGATFSHAMTAGANVSSITAGGQINVTDMRPTAGTGISVSGTQVNWDPRCYWGLVMVNATVNTGTGAITTGVAAVNAFSAPYNFFKWGYRCVPVRATGIGGTGGWTVVYDDDAIMIDGLSGSGASRTMWNCAEQGNASDFVQPGVSLAGTAYPDGFEPMPLGYNVQNSTWNSFVWPAFRYRVATGSYLWMLANSQTHDGECSSAQSNYFPGGW